MGAALRHPRGLRHDPRCGHGHAGFTASDIAGDQRGVGLLIAEGEQPVRLRSYWLSDADLDTLAARARHLRDDTVVDLDAKRKGA